MRFLQVIIVATPCPLLLAAPIALISGMSRASKYGSIIKTGSALERLADIRTMAFDKTGTLTKGEPVVAEVKTFASYTVSEVLSIAASLEQSSNHILARAVTAAADKKKVAYSKAKHVMETAGHGLSARIKNQEVLVGRLSYIADHDISMPTGFKPAEVSKTASYVAVDGKLVGVIHFEDELRPEAKSTLASLKKLGIKHLLMLTGDNQAAAKQVAKTLGISNFEAETLPAQKLHAIEKVDVRPVGFVGDGVNDAPVLTAADVGIALGARGSTAASESADVVIMQDDLSYVPRAVATAQRALTIAKQSIVIGISISFVLMAFFATGKFSPVLGAILQEVVDVVVIFNALRAHNIKVLE
jgi:heavy metal translocating P-type ATPase